MNHARSLVAVAVAVAVVASASLGAPPLAADDAPEWRPPEHESSDMAFHPDAMPKDLELLPEGARPAEEAEKAITAAVEAIATEKKVPAGQRTLVLRTVKFEKGVFVTFGLLDLWIEPGEVPAALEAKAKEKGWAFRAMGSPARLLVVLAPEALREKAVALQVRVAGARLGEAALDRFAHSAPEAGAALAATAHELLPGLSTAHLAKAYAALPPWTKGDPKPRPEAYDASLSELAKAIDENAVLPFDKKRRATAKTGLGNSILTSGGRDETARDLLKAGIEEGLAANLEPERLHGARYNLACAHARLKDKAAAYATLQQVLEAIKDKPVEGLSDWWEKDPDFDSLHADPEWADLVKLYGGKKEAPPEPAMDDAGMGGDGK